MKRTLLALSLGALLAALVAVPARAAVTLSYVSAPAAKLTGATSADRQYDSDTIVWLRCRAGAVALMAGWSDARAPVAIIYSHLLAQHRYLGIAVRKPFKTAKVRGGALCAKGVRFSTRTSGYSNQPSSAVKRVACKRGQLAIGVPIDGGPYWDTAVASKPDGLRGWTSSQTGYAAAKVICVSARSFRSAKLVRKAATFKAGKATTTVAAKCAGGRRPISWGFEAGLLEGNTWRSVESTSTMSVPFIAASQPRGRNGWALTFATPDGEAATSTTTVAVHLTCAIPR